MADYVKSGAGIAGLHGQTPVTAGYAAVGLTAGGIGLLNADVFVKAGRATSGLVGSGVLVSDLNKTGYARVGTVAVGSALVVTEFLHPAGEHDLVLTPESADSFLLNPSVPGAFALTPLEEEDFVLTSHPNPDSG